MGIGYFVFRKYKNMQKKLLKQIFVEKSVD